MAAQDVVAVTAIALILAVNAGVVLAKPGDPIPDIDVVIGSRPDGKVVQQVKTDSQGNFTSGVLPKGTYVLTFRPRPVAASAPAAANPAPQIAGGTVTQRGGASAPPPAGSERKSFFESRSNVRISAGSGSAAPVARTMPLTQELVVEAPGGQPIKGRIVE